MNNPTGAPQTPQQAALERIESIHAKVNDLLTHTTNVLERALQDAVSMPGASASQVLAESSLTEIAQIKNGLSELTQYYARQVDQMSAVVREQLANMNKAAPDAEEAIAAETAGPSQAPALVNATEALRQRIERRAAGVPAEEEQSPVSAEAFVQPPVETVSVSSLPAVQDVAEKPAALLTPAQMQDSFEKLLGEDSPLLDIFAPSPWIPNGRGNITVSSEGFKWYQRTDPLQRTPAERAGLPTGFYSGDDQPRYVLLRLETVIVLWSMSMESEAIHLYIAGASEVGSQPRWFHPHQLSASFTRRVNQELENYKRKLNQPA